jgi:hypothetical protein
MYGPRSPEQLNHHSILSGWNRYPANLSAVFPDDDFELRSRRLRNHAKRLFNSDVINVRFHTIIRARNEANNEAAKPPTSITDSVTDEMHIEEVLVVRRYEIFNWLSLTFYKKHLTTHGDHYM